jgi:hypothetical protein
MRNMCSSKTVVPKLQKHPLLAQFLAPSATDNRARLIDYELLTDMSGKRVVALGWHTDAVDLVEGLITSAHANLKLGVAFPFLASTHTLYYIPN